MRAPSRGLSTGSYPPRAAASFCSNYQLIPISGLDPNAIVARHIKLLHTYNETKDTSQMLIAIVSPPHSVITASPPVPSLTLVIPLSPFKPSRLLAAVDLTCFYLGSPSSSFISFNLTSHQL